MEWQDLLCIGLGCTHLQVANGSIEWIIAQASLLVQEFTRFAIGRRCKESIVEALLQLLQKEEEEGGEGGISWSR